MVSVAPGRFDYSNLAVDALIDEAPLQLDPVKRRIQVKQIQRLLQEDGPIPWPFIRPGTWR